MTDGHRIRTAFTTWLAGEGWTVHSRPSGADVAAERDALQLYAAIAEEAAVSAVHEAYGRLLTAMSPDREGAAFALVVPDAAARHAVAVHPDVRVRLGIEVHSVDEPGHVRLRR